MLQMAFLGMEEGAGIEPPPRRPSVAHAPGYPLAGCSPAEPASVSPGAQRYRKIVRKLKVSRIRKRFQTLAHSEKVAPKCGKVGVP